MYTQSKLIQTAEFYSDIIPEALDNYCMQSQLLETNKHYQLIFEKYNSRHIRLVSAWGQ